MNSKLDNPPWKEKGMSYRARLLARLGFIAAFVLILCPGMPFAYILFTPSRKTGGLWDDTFPIILLLSVLAGAIFAIIKLRSSWHAPINFTPSYNPIAPSRLGETFEVWYQETSQASPFGQGTIVFQASELILEGYLFRGSLYSLLGQWQGKKVLAKVLYSDISSVSIKGRYIILKAETGLMPQATIAFYVAEMDVERMLRELKHYFPSQL